jgi:hypothetical protein
MLSQLWGKPVVAVNHCVGEQQQRAASARVPAAAAAACRLALRRRAALQCALSGR